MGMYTEIYMSVGLIKNIPDDVLNTLQCMFNGKGEPDKLPDHELFQKERWGMIGRCASYYFVPEATSHMFQCRLHGNYFITSRSDLKNYDGEIEAFFDWLMPYIDAPEGQFIGYTRYEENDQPTLIFNTQQEK